MRRAAPGQVAGLHRAAAGWLAGHGYPAEAVRHAQAAQDWPLAARLLADHWPGLFLDGRTGAVQELVAGFPAGLTAADAGLAVVAAADELARGSLEAAERCLSLAERGLDGVPEAGQRQARLLLAVVRMLHARQRGDLPTVTEAAGRLRDMAEGTGNDPAAPGLGADLSTLALIGLGSTEAWAGASDDAKRHLERGVELARRIGRPYLEFTGLAYRATGLSRSFMRRPPAARSSRRSSCLHYRLRRRVRAGQVLAPDPDYGQRDDCRQHEDARRDQVAPGEPGRQRVVVDLGAQRGRLGAGDVDGGLGGRGGRGSLAAGHRAPGHGADDGQPD
jgi:LuxR family transcriptional regulator, maltose regulon positive regulatory protein